jgi:hypothetical protein
VAEKPGQRSPPAIKKPARPLVYDPWSARRFRIPDGEIAYPIALGMPQIVEHRLTSAFHSATHDPVPAFV